MRDNLISTLLVGCCMAAFCFDHVAFTIPGLVSQYLLGLVFVVGITSGFLIGRLENWLRSAGGRIDNWLLSRRRRQQG